MTVLIVLLVVSVSVAAGFLIAFLWAVRNRQFDDLETPAVRILFDHPVSITDKKDSSRPPSGGAL